MSTSLSQPSPADQAAASPLNGVVPPAEHRFKPGQSGNPTGRPAAGATIKEWLNVLADADLTEDEVRAIARDRKAPWTKRAAAERVLRSIEAGDLADFVPVVRGEMSLDQLREAGVNTEIVKKLKRRVRRTMDGDTEEESEIELHDRAGVDFDRIVDRTHGRPTQPMNVRATGLPDSVQIITPGITMRVVGPRREQAQSVMAPSLEFLLKHGEAISPGTPIVFCGIDRRELAGRDLPPHMTGVLVKREFKPTLETALRLHPGTRHVVFVAGTSAFNQYWTERARREFSEFEGRVKITYLTDLPMESLQAEVARLPHRVARSGGKGEAQVAHLLPQNPDRLDLARRVTPRFEVVDVPPQRLG